MKGSTRIGIAATVAALAALFSGTALAALTPTFAVSGPRLGADSAFGPTVEVSWRASDDPVANLAIYVPVGYTLSSPASPSSTIGNVAASAQIGDRSNAVQALKGTIVGTPTAGAPSCDARTHRATWTMNLTLPGGEAYTVPLFVDDAAGAETAYASYRVVACLPPSDVPAGTAGRAPLGAKLLSARFNLDAFTGQGNGEQLWRSLSTPYTPRSGETNTAGAVEAQSIVRVPTVVTLAAKRVHRNRSTSVTLSGTLKENGAAIAKVPVTISSGPRTAQLSRLRVVTTDAVGGFTTSLSITKTRWFGATASIPQRSLDASACKPTFGVPCTSATVGAARVVGKAVKVAR
jgi:hypothetical protein